MLTAPLHEKKKKNENVLAVQIKQYTGHISEAARYRGGWNTIFIKSGIGNYKN